MIVEYNCIFCKKKVRKKRSPANMPVKPKFCNHNCRANYIKEQTAMKHLALLKKLCLVCSKEKSISEFYPRWDRTNGYIALCKECYNKERYKKRIHQNKLSYYLKITKDNYHKNIEHSRERARIWRSKNTIIVNMAAKKYRDTHREKVVQFRRNRKALLRGATGKFNHTDVHELLKNQKNKCAICSIKFSKKSFHVDHVYPISKGGINTLANIQLLCPSCNLSKSNKDPIQFMQQRGFLL